MKTDLFYAFCEKVRSFGYEVYTNKPGSCGNYAIVTDGVCVGRMGEADFNQKAVVFGTVHRPCNGYGTGFRCRFGEADEVTLDDLSAKHVEASFTLVPESYGGPVDLRKIVKFRSFEDWKKHSLFSDLYSYES